MAGHPIGTTLTIETGSTMSPSSAPEKYVHEPIAEADPRVTFEELGVMPDIVEALAEIGITHPFPSRPSRSRSRSREPT